MAYDLRYPASVSENIVRALRKVAGDVQGEFKPEQMWQMKLSAWDFVSVLRALADELEAGKSDEDGK